jgi:hypothetical protein
MNEEIEKQLDLEYAAKHSLPTHMAPKVRALRLREVTRRSERRRPEAVKEHIRNALADHPERYVITLDGKRIVQPNRVGPRGFVFYCDCGRELPEIERKLTGLACSLWPNLSRLPDAGHEEGDIFLEVKPGVVPTISETHTCPACRKSAQLKIVLVPGGNEDGGQ